MAIVMKRYLLLMVDCDAAIANAVSVCRQSMRLHLLPTLIKVRTTLPCRHVVVHGRALHAGSMASTVTTSHHRPAMHYVTVALCYAMDELPVSHEQG